MHLQRYIVISEHGTWRIVRGSGRPRDPYPTKREAVCAAMEFAERDGYAEAEVLVRHEDGYFGSEWVHRGSHPDNPPGPENADRRKGKR